MTYPKINSLYKRYEYEEAVLLGEKKKAGKIMEGILACREFESIDYWTITEKVDGTNIRICMDTARANTVKFGGRTEGAQLPTSLLSVLQDIFTWEKMSTVFKSAQSVMLFGEGYGGNIQDGLYGVAPSFVLFDAYVDGWWLDVSKVHQLARDLGIKSVPLLEHYIVQQDMPGIYMTTFILTKKQVVDYVKLMPDSLVSHFERPLEGVVARSEPLMLFRDGTPIMFKLKCKDFE